MIGSRLQFFSTTMDPRNGRAYCSVTRFAQTSVPPLKKLAWEADVLIECPGGLCLLADGPVLLILHRTFEISHNLRLNMTANIQHLVTLSNPLNGKDARTFSADVWSTDGEERKKRSEILLATDTERISIYSVCAR